MTMKCFHRGLSLLLCGFVAMASAAALAADEPATQKVEVAKSFRASQLNGLDVKNSAGEVLGSVEDTVIDVANGKVAYVALSFGGVLGIGDKLFAVPFRQVKFKHGQEEMFFVLDVAKDKLKAAPGFDKSNWPDFADPKWMESIDEFYSDEVAATGARKSQR